MADYVSTGGTLAISTIAAYLGLANTNANLNMTQFRTLAGIASGQISISNFYNKCTCYSYVPCSCDDYCACDTYFG